MDGWASAAGKDSSVPSVCMTPSYGGGILENCWHDTMHYTIHISLGMLLIIKINKWRPCLEM
jgi:hypothetical protein